MVTSTLVDAARRARDSWRGQLAVLAAGAVLLGLTLLGGGDAGDAQLRAIVGSIEALLLLAISIRMAAVAEAGYDGDLPSIGFEVAMLLPRLVTQVGAIAIMPVVATALALFIAGSVTVAGLVTVPVAFVVIVFAFGPALLAASAVVLGDRGWWPRSTLSAIRGQQVRIAMIMLAGGVVASVAALPLALVGFVINANGGMLGFVGVGLVASGAIPWFGCGALATWRAIGATVQVADSGSDEAAVDGEMSGVAASVQALASTPWMEGPAWDVAVEPGAVWGTWIRIDAASVLGVRVTWHGGAAPELSFASEAGVWTKAADLATSGDILQVALPAGSTYLQIASRAAASQAVTVGLLVPPAVAA